MAVDCAILKTTGALKDKDAYYVNPETYSLIKGDDLLDLVDKHFHVSSGMLHGAISDMVRQMVSLMKIGHRVEVPGLGFFSIKMKAEVERDGKGVLQIKDARYAGIHFKPDKKFARQLMDTEFKLISHNAPLIYNHLTDEEALEIARKLSAVSGYFILHNFYMEADVSYSYARDLLKRLAKEGKLEDIGARYHPRYRLPKE